MLTFSGIALSAVRLVSTFAAVPANAAIQIAASDNGGAIYTLSPAHVARHRMKQLRLISLMEVAFL
jgi:hypothetical protein